MNLLGSNIVSFSESVLFVGYVLLMGVDGILDAHRQKLNHEWKRNCPLEADSVHPWLVKIWDIDYANTMAHGSILAPKVVLSSCSCFIDATLRLSQYLIVGQHVPKGGTPKDDCIQARRADQIICHPKCTRADALEDEPRSIEFVNLAIWILVTHIYFEGGFPALKFRLDKGSFLSDLQKFEAAPDSAECVLPTFVAKNKIHSYFSDVTNVSFIPYMTECIKMLCADASDKDACENSSGTAKQGSRMCVSIASVTPMPDIVGLSAIDWYDGAPLVCNGLGYGISTRTVLRSENQSRFHLITTFLEHRTWLSKTLKKFEPSTWANDFDTDTDTVGTTTRNPNILINENDYIEETTLKKHEPPKPRHSSRSVPPSAVFFTSILGPLVLNILR